MLENRKVYITPYEGEKNVEKKQGEKLSKRRTKIEIIRDMLEIMIKEEGVKKTEIVYGANLNFERASRILKWLIEKGLVKVESDRYKATKEGREILRRIDKLAELFR